MLKPKVTLLRGALWSSWNSDSTSESGLDSSKTAELMDHIYVINLKLNTRAGDSIIVSYVDRCFKSFTLHPMFIQSLF